MSKKKIASDLKGMSKRRVGRKDRCEMGRGIGPERGQCRHRGNRAPMLTNIARRVGAVWTSWICESQEPTGREGYCCWSQPVMDQMRLVLGRWMVPA